MVDDGSVDSTLDMMKKVQAEDSKHVSIVSLTRNFGLEGAVRAGLEMARGDAVVVMDADLQDPPALLIDMIAKWKQGADIVVAVRKNRENDTFFKRLTASLFYKLLDSLSGKLKIRQDAANFRLLSRRAVTAILNLPEVNAVFRVIVPFIGMKTETVEYSRQKREAGNTKYTFKMLLHFAFDNITGISIEPIRKLRLLLYVTGILFLLAICFTVFAENYWKMAFFVCAVTAFFFGLLFVAVTVISEYIAQIMIETKGRPVSLIYEYIPAENANIFSDMQ
jgi:dolichol-phosphate mannosyltransferase